MDEKRENRNGRLFNLVYLMWLYMYSYVEVDSSWYWFFSLFLLLFFLILNPLFLTLFHLYMYPFLLLSSSLFLLFTHILLFPHTGSLIQVPMSEKGKITRGRLGSLSLKKEGERQCFLFSKHLIICTRGSGGKLHLTKVRCWASSGATPYFKQYNLTAPQNTESRS